MYLIADNNQFTFRELPEEIEAMLFKYDPQFPQLRKFLSIQLYLNQFLLEIERKSELMMLPLSVACELTILEMFNVVEKNDVEAAIKLCQDHGQYLPEVLINMMHTSKEQPSPFMA